jgi:elongation factor G
MGELHLEIIKNKLTRDMKVDVEVGKPRVSYREAIRAPPTRSRQVQEADGWSRSVRRLHDQHRAVHRRAGGGSGPEVQGQHRVREQDRRRLDPEGVHPVGRGRASARRRSRASSAGYPLINIKVTLVDGSYHDVDSSQVAFEQAARLACVTRVTRPAACCSSRS